MNPASRTLTFLFTDIEASSRLWEKYPDAMRVAVARHDAILREAIETQRGQVVKTTGDGFHAVFAIAQDAVAASLHAQRDLQKENWDDRTPLRVRMGMHTGTSEEREGDFYGPVLNRAARLMAVGCGGQVLLSKTTYELARDHTPREIAFRDLGEHRLRDLSRPEHIYQLIAPALALDFPALKTLEAHPNNLPIQLTNFIGREKEIAHVKQVLTNARLVTLTGVGGSGKTRLALQVAAEMLEIFPEGIWLIELATLTDPALVPQAIASVLHLREEQNRALLQTLTDHLQVKKYLLVLDNCEHLVDACAKLAETLLRACPQMKILTTSREPLGIGGEKTVRVPSLTLPDIKNLPAPETFGAYEAIHLFTDRVTAIQSNFQITAANASAVAQICYRLDGIPLAIELAAARVKSLGIEHIAARLDDRFRLLSGGNRTAMPRQQTLRALMDWSYDLLLEKERILLRRLAVFVGGWTLDAAEKVCNDERIAEKEVLDLLIKLVDKSLVNLDDIGAETRYQMHETVRQYALNKLIESGEAEVLRERHLDYFVAYAEKAEPKLKSKGADQALAVKTLEVEHENLRAALEWSQNETGGAEKGLRLSGALGRFWEKRNALTEGREWLRKFLDLSKDSRDDVILAKALNAGANLAYLQADYESAISQFRQRLTIAESESDDRDIADAHMGLGTGWWRLGDYDQAHKHFAQAIQRAEVLGDIVLVARAHGNLGLVLTERGDLDRAIESHRASLEAFLRAGLHEYVGRAQLNLGRIYHMRGEFAQATAYYLESIHTLESIGDENTLSIVFNNLGELNLDQGNYSEALSFVQKSVRIAERSRNEWTLSVSYRIVAGIYLEQHQTDLASSFVERALQQNVQSEDQLALIYFRRAEIRAAQGKRSQAQADFEAACCVLEKLQKKSELARLYRAYGMFLSDDSTARRNGYDLLQKAATLFSELGAVKEVEKTIAHLRKFSTETQNFSKGDQP